MKILIIRHTFSNESHLIVSELATSIAIEEEVSFSIFKLQITARKILTTLFKSPYFPDHHGEKISVLDKILELLQLFKVEPPMCHDRAFVGAGTSLSVTSSKDLFCRPRWGVDKTYYIQ